MRTIVIGLTLAAVLAGCGKKGDPLPPAGYDKGAPAAPVQPTLPPSDNMPAPAGQ